MIGSAWWCRVGVCERRIIGGAGGGFIGSYERWFVWGVYGVFEGWLKGVYWAFEGGMD